jgi:hypothetical protein
MAGRRNVAKQAERRKRLMLVGLMVVLVAVLAFQLPKLMKGSGSSSSAASTPSTTTAVPSTATSATRSLTVTKTSVSARRIRAIRGMAAKDLFVPLIHDSTSTPSSESSSTASSAPVPAASSSTPAPASTAPAISKPAHVKPAVPTAAVIWTNGARQVVGVSQVFSVGDAQFKLVAVTRDAVRIKALGGAFSGRGPAITVQKGRRVKLANMATGVQYSLLFSEAGIAAPSSSSNSN